jgi:CDP-paratose 2-epimerase
VVKVLITGVAGFLGSRILQWIRTQKLDWEVWGIDNLSRKGAERNLAILENLGCHFIQGDIADPTTIAKVPTIDYVIDCAANPSVLAGMGGGTLRLLKDNLEGTFYLLEKCKADQAGFVLISTSRVYSIAALNQIPLSVENNRYVVDEQQAHNFPVGFSAQGIEEHFSTQAPISLYGATKLASEQLALEYHHAFGIPVWINRAGVIAGAGQFGKIDQGIFSFWVYQYLLDRPLAFMGYGGHGWQSRDVVHPNDIAKLVVQQMTEPVTGAPRIVNVGGGKQNTLSLAELDTYCAGHFKKSTPVQAIAENRALDIPMYYTNSALAKQWWNWQPTYTAEQILDEIRDFAKTNQEFVEAIS